MGNKHTQYSYRDMVLAAEAKGDTVKPIRKMIKQGLPIDGIMPREERHANFSRTASPLLVAISAGNVRIVDFLLKAGANANLALVDTAEDWHTPMKWAISGGNAAIVKLLLEHGAVTDGGMYIHQAAMCLARPILAYTEARQEVFNTLVSGGVDVNERWPGTGTTALMSMAGEGSIIAVVTLLTAGADPDLKDSGNRTALDYALRASHAGVMVPLLRAMKR